MFSQGNTDPTERHTMSKFDSTRDEILYTLTTSGLWGAESGHVASPQGWFGQMTIIDDDDLGRIKAEIGDEYAFGAFGSLIGYWLIRENSDGYVSTTQFDTRAELETVYGALEADFAVWVGDEDDEYEPVRDAPYLD